MKEAANVLYKEKKFLDAVNVYTRAIQLNATAVYYGNRSSAYFKLNRFDYAIADATQAITIDRTYSKGYTRRADAHIALEHYPRALEDYKRARNIDRNNTLLLEQINKCKKHNQEDGNFCQILYRFRL